MGNWVLSPLLQKSIIDSHPTPPIAQSTTLLIARTSLAIKSSTYICLPLEGYKKDFYFLETCHICPLIDLPSPPTPPLNKSYLCFNQRRSIQNLVLKLPHVQTKLVASNPIIWYNTPVNSLPLKTTTNAHGI